MDKKSKTIIIIVSAITVLLLFLGGLVAINFKLGKNRIDTNEQIVSDNSMELGNGNRSVDSTESAEETQSVIESEDMTPKQIDTSREGSYAETDEIFDGYLAIYEELFESDDYIFTPDCNAKGYSRYILKEDDASVEFLVYDRDSDNGKCELYVYYRAEKAEDGSWSPTEAQILEMYAYEIATGNVIISGKASWSDLGNEEYRAATGE